MSYFGNRLSITSAIGVNSDTVISGGNWSTNTYTGTGELNDYAYVGVNLQVDEAGTLYFDFSQDGTNWSTFPVAGFTIASGINEVHTAWKGGRYIRPRFVGVGGRTYFRLKTFYSNLPLPLSAPLNQSINGDQDASVVRSVIVGETDGGKYINAPVDINGHLEVAVHSLDLPNTLLTTSFGNPAFPFTLASYSAGSTTNLTVKSGSVAGFIEGMKMLHGNRFTYYNQLTTVGSTNLQALFTIINTRYYSGRANQSVINLLSVSSALKHSSPCILYLIKGGTLAGNPNFQSISSNSSSLWDTASTTVTYTTGDQLLWTGHLGDTGEIDHHFGNGTYNAEELTLQPGEWLTLAARSVTGSPAYVTGSINTREDK